MVLVLFRRRRRRRSRHKARLRKARWIGSGFAVGAACALALQDDTFIPYAPVEAAGITVWNGVRALRRAVGPKPLRQVAATPGKRTVGIVRVVDGDTVELSTGLRRVKVRVRALHAPELPNADGIRARRTMEKLAARGPFVCVATGARSYDRIVADCKSATGEDVATALIRAGVATHCERYGRPDLAALTQPSAIWNARPGYCRRKG